MHIKHIHKSLASKIEKTFFYINFDHNRTKKTKITLFYFNFVC